MDDSVFMNVFCCRLEVHLVGGFRDEEGHSKKLSLDILSKYDILKRFTEQIF